MPKDHEHTSPDRSPLDPRTAAHTATMQALLAWARTTQRRFYHEPLIGGVTFDVGSMQVIVTVRSRGDMQFTIAGPCASFSVLSDILDRRKLP